MQIQQTKKKNTRILHAQMFTRNPLNIKKIDNEQKHMSSLGQNYLAGWLGVWLVRL